MKQASPSLFVVLVFWCLSFHVLLFGQERLSSLEVQGSFGVKTYKGSTSKGLKISHEDGLSVIPFTALPDTLRARYAAPDAPVTSSPAAPLPVIASAEVPPGSLDPHGLVLIKTEGPQGASAGSGFIVRAGDKTYVYTNAHVLCGEPGDFTLRIISIKTAAGDAIAAPYELELSETHDAANRSGLEDMARFAISSKGVSGYEITSLDTAAVGIDQKVTAFGNSEGSDVITALEGQVLGIASDRMEVSCDFVHGNSGGPVVLKGTSKVIGISTYLHVAREGDRSVQGTRFEKMRRFAIRPDKVTKWRKMQYTSLITALAEMNDFHRDTLTLLAACALAPNGAHSGFEIEPIKVGEQLCQDIITKGSGGPLGRVISQGIGRVNQRLGQGTITVAGSTAAPVFGEFYGAIAAASNSQTKVLAMADRAPYVKQFIGALCAERAQVVAKFNEMGSSFR